jgi:hypothetical protein
LIDCTGRLIIYYFKSLQDKTDQVAEMVTIMKEAINVDEKIKNENDEKIERLLTENRGLRELLQIQTKYNFNGDNCNKEDKEVQTIVLFDEPILPITTTASETSC